MRWKLKPAPEPKKIISLARELQVEETIASLLVQRGIETFEQAKSFFRPSLKHLHNPFLMKDMDAAVSRIEKAIENQEKIMVFGDYDVDGTSAVALMSSYLKTIHPQIITYIPDRYNEGYGVSLQGIDYAASNHVSLIIALDCGIKAIDKVAYAKQKQIDFIICDHHLPGAELPKAVAVLDPKRADCNYPYKELCGCGVGFKLVQALASKRGTKTEQLVTYLDLVATAIGADIVPITGENRVLAYFGLKQINTDPRPGFKAIIEQLNKKELEIHDVVFVIAPRINAAGRMQHGIHAVELMTETELEKARLVAKEIEAYNLERRDTDQEITQEALELIEKSQEENRFTTVVYQEHWHKGVIGIVASRLTETYYRPTLVFTKSGNKLAASARSVKGFDVYNALEACQEHIEQFGGHKYAAGLTLKPEQYLSFKEAFEQEVKNSIDPALLVPEISIDAEIDLNEITPKFYRILKQFAPFGPGNMTPVFLTKQLQDNGWSKPVGTVNKHLKLTVKQKQTGLFNGIGFNLGEKYNSIKNKALFQAVYTIDENTYNGKTSIQLRVRDIKAQ